MRFLCPLVRTLPLLLAASWTSVASADSAATPASPPQRIQIQCTALRARTVDLDAVGIIYDILLPNKALIPNLSDPAQPTCEAQIANNAQARLMLQYMQPVSHPERYTTYTAPVVTIADSQSGIISLVKLSNLGLTKTPSLVVIPHVQTDGTIKLFVSPRFSFVRVPLSEDDGPIITTEGFSFSRIIPNGSMMAFSEEPRPAPQSHFHWDFRQKRVGLTGNTILFVFLTVTTLPETLASTPSVESPHHA